METKSSKDMTASVQYWKFSWVYLGYIRFLVDRDRTPPRPPPTKIFAFLCKKHVTFQDFPNHNYLQCLGWIATKARDLLACQTVFPLAVFVCCEFMENTNTNVVYSGRYSNSSEGNNCGFAECNVAREEHWDVNLKNILFFLNTLLDCAFWIWIDF